MPEERNYHVFYRLLAGLDKEEKSRLHLTMAEDYHYLSQGNCFTCDGMDDEQEFANIRRAMKVIKMLMTHLQQKDALFISQTGEVCFTGALLSNFEADGEQSCHREFH